MTFLATINVARAPGPVLVEEVISREHALVTGADPDAEEVVSREVSLVLSDAALPPTVPGLTLTVSPTLDAVTVDWSGYNQWTVRDVA